MIGNSVNMNEVFNRAIESGIIAVCFMFLLHWVLRRFSADLRLLTVQLQTNTLTLIGLQKQFLMHDAQVRGINPSTGEDVDDRMKMAIEEYKALQSSLDALAKQVTQVQVEVNTKGLL